MRVNTCLCSPFRSTVIERFPPQSLVVVKAQDRLARAEFCLNVWHPRGLRSRHRKFRVSFYLPHTKAALCRSYYSEEIVRQEEWIQVFRLWRIWRFWRGTCAIVPPKEFHLFCVILVRGSTWTTCSTAWQECHLLAGGVTAPGGHCVRVFFNGLSSSNQWMRAAVFLDISFLNLCPFYTFLKLLLEVNFIHPSMIFLTLLNPHLGRMGAGAYPSWKSIGHDASH